MRILTALRLTLLLALIAALFAACSRDPNVRKQKYFESGQSYFEKGKFEEAAIEFRNAVAVDPTYAAAHDQLGMTYLKTPAVVTGKSGYSHVRSELQPENYPARIELGQTADSPPETSQQAQEQAGHTLLRRVPELMPQVSLN